MKHGNKVYAVALAVGMLFAATPVLALPPPATAAGTEIKNQATVSYFMGPLIQLPVNSNISSFLVDRKILLTVIALDASIVGGVPNQTAVITTFRVTNNSNSTEDFRLGAGNSATGTSALGEVDDFDVSITGIFVETNGTPGYQSGAGGDNTSFIDELAPGASAMVYVLANIPSAQVNGDVAVVALTATAAQSTDGNGFYLPTIGVLAADASQTNIGVADVSTFVDTVFADTAGATDSTRDGKFSAFDAYKLVTATIAILKSSVVVSDPVNGTTNPKAIPGAVIEYCLVVNNTGSATATGITVSDAIPANTSYTAGTIKANSSGTSAVCTLGSGTAVADGGDALGDFGVTAANSVTLNAGSVAPGGTYRGVFRVNVN